VVLPWVVRGPPVTGASPDGTEEIERRSKEWGGIGRAGDLGGRLNMGKVEKKGMARVRRERVSEVAGAGKASEGALSGPRHSPALVT